MRHAFAQDSRFTRPKIGNERLNRMTDIAHVKTIRKARQQHFDESKRRIWIEVYVAGENAAKPA